MFTFKKNIYTPLGNGTIEACVKRHSLQIKTWKNLISIYKKVQKQHFPKQLWTSIGTGPETIVSNVVTCKNTMQK